MAGFVAGFDGVGIHVVTSGTRNGQTRFASSLFPAFPERASSGPNGKAQRPRESRRALRRAAKLSPRAFHRGRVPEMTVWSGEFRLARNNFACAARLQHPLRRPGQAMIAAMAPTPRNRFLHIGAALANELHASANFSAPAATSANTRQDYASDEIGVKPFSASTRQTATEQVKIAVGCSRQLQFFFRAFKTHFRDGKASA